MKDWKPDTENRHIRRSKIFAAIIGRARFGKVGAAGWHVVNFFSDFRAADL